MTTRLRRVTVLGHEVRISVRQGTEPGPPLVLCNGIGASLDLLEPFVDALDPRIEVVSFDVPGAGGSPAPADALQLPDARVVPGKAARPARHDKFDVLGISWGGGLAQQLAFQHPGRCRRLVLVSTATGSLMLPASPLVLSKMVTPTQTP